jgi:hypothetical protein
VYAIRNTANSVKSFDPKYNKDLFMELYAEPTDLNEFLNNTIPEDIEFTIETKKSPKKKSPKKSTAKMESGKKPKSPKKKLNEKQ